MSNHRAISAVTATLFNIFEAGKVDAGTSITTKPPDKARDGGTGDQLNLFLYHTAVSAAWRNMDPPRRVKPGESGHPSLALDLHYLITAYGQSDSEIAAHRILGRAMENLHDHPVLGRGELESADAASLLHEQVERVRITPEPLSLDDMYKLWSSFQTQYRPSAAYRVSVVLIDSQRASKAALPVLTRGEGDRGIAAQADLVPPFPALTQVSPLSPRPAARLGETITLEGHHLDGDSVDVLLHHPRLAEPIVLAPEAGATESRLEVVLPAVPPPPSPAFLAGIYSVSAVIHRAGESDRSTNQLPLALAPRITGFAPDPAALDTVSELEVSCEPEVLPEQAPRLLLGDRSLAPASFPGASATLDFPLGDTPPGSYFLRLRVDGVDSLLIDYGQTPPVFDPNQKATPVETI